MDEQLPIIEFAFPGPLRDRLIAAIRSGAKTSTSSTLRGYEVDAEPLPEVGQRGAVVDSNGERVMVLEITGVDIVPLSEVSLQHALDEGEGFTTVEDWRTAHTRFWMSPEVLAEVGDDFELTDETLIVLERFVVR